MKAQGERSARLDVQELLDLARGSGGQASFEAFQALRSGRSRVAALRAFYRLREWLLARDVEIEKRTESGGECWISLDVEAASELLGRDTAKAKRAVQRRRTTSNAVTCDADVTLLSLKVAAKHLDMDVRRLRAALDRRRPLLPFVRLGAREKKIRLSDLRTFVESRLVPGPRA